MAIRISTLIASLLLFFCLGLQPTKSTTNDTVMNTIQPGQSLKKSETIQSANGNFELRFFSPVNSTKYYMVIRYKNVYEKNIVWVANREYPIPNSTIESAVLTLNLEGNLLISDGKMTYMMANSSAGNDTYVMLLDTGNLILTNKVLEVLWQSFDYPTHTLLPGMKLGKDFKTGHVWSLTSWKSAEDFAPGRFSLQLTRRNQLTIMEGSKVYWTTLLDRFGVLSYNWSLGYVTWPINYTSNLSRITLDVNGQLKLQSWSEIDQKWHPLKSSRCGDYDCGAFSICNETAHVHDLACVCLTGFKPISADAWRKGNASSGCVRKTALRCTNNTNVQKDGFLTMFKVYWPDNPLHLDMGDEKKCESACLNNCSCIAYAYEYEHFKNGHNFSMFRCFVWNGFLLNLKQHSVYARYAKDFYLKLAPSDLVTQGKNYIRNFWLLVE
jgi:hypothetical protein